VCRVDDAVAGRRSKTALAAAVTLAVLAVPVSADLFSSYDVSGRGGDGSSYTGNVKITPAGQTYRLDYCCVQFDGLAIEYRDFLAIAYFSKDNGGDLNIYKRAADAWIGVFSDYGDGNLGAEVLYNGSTPPDVPNPPRAGKLAGKYQISGTNPDGSTYTGEAEVSDWADKFDVDRKIGNNELSGTAVGLDGAFAMNVNKSDNRAQIGVLGLFVPEANGFVGVWVAARGQRLGAERWVRR
jgi:hypothetical protein